jgi:perosamine synthetase
VFTNSGTSSLQIALAALKESHRWEDGDEVLCPATTFIATSNVILQNRMRPVFVDVDPEIYSMDPSRMEDRVGPRTRCAIAVHLYGHPAEMGSILEICRRRNLRLIEDSAETMFATCGGQSVGSFGDIGCFSTYAAHILVTGVGGLNTTNDAELAIMMRSIMNHGRDSIYLNIDDDKDQTDAGLRTVMERRFRFVRMGYSYRCTELEAALGCAQMEEAPANVKARRENARVLTDTLRRWNRYLQLPLVRPDCTHSFMMYPILVRPDAGFTREDLTFELEQRNIETRTMVSILDQPFYRELFGLRLEDEYPVARWIDSAGFYIGCHMGMTPEELDFIGRSFDHFFRNRDPQAPPL